MRRKALEGEGGAILSTYLAAEEGAVCCMVTASADKTQQEAQTPDQASQWWLVFRASAGGVIVASRPAEACLLRWGTGKQADWGRPLVGPVTGTRYGPLRYRWRLDTGLQYWHGQASFLHIVLQRGTISRRRHSLHRQERTAIAPFGSAQRGWGYVEFRHVFQLSKAGERIGQRGKWEKYTGRPRTVGEAPSTALAVNGIVKEGITKKPQFVLK
jgi:hypothetical protein